MQAGKLTHRIEIQQRAIVKDSHGNDIEEWTTLFDKVPADHIPLSVRDLMAANASQSQIRGRFVIRYHRSLDGIGTITRIIFREKIYDVQDWLTDKDSGVQYLTAPYTRGVNRGGF